MFVNKTSCAHNIWYTGISITTTEHRSCLRPFPPLAVWKTERERGLSNYRGATESNSRQEAGTNTSTETNHLKQTTIYKMAVIQEAGLET